MKKTALCAMLTLAVSLLCGCSPMVSYIRFPSDEDDTRYNEVFEADVGGSDAVIFYADEELYDVQVIETEYVLDAYHEIREIWRTDTLKKGDGIKITLDFSDEIPYVMVRYTRKNGETREQYIYKKPQTGKLWLLELK